MNHVTAVNVAVLALSPGMGRDPGIHVHARILNGCQISLALNTSVNIYDECARTCLLVTTKTHKG